ncbi:DNA-binding response OmpR family regulator [Aequitasia blattaphilus]|uniref:Stage 0 sporulation protein A homolog n=1 Tax=Aequitasia blattaphilus TaxID=2949332 RepID=A0ABT1EC74_9FIRM|nr:response regulator transcription factor [Aequitasia blattaphilus]MCP1103425.1 response regulator transcription factor [Aequitasia blattaphilus]MCR8616065.1 response regulator transcription factor [Aequitasia blattaphilus]
MKKILIADDNRQITDILKQYAEDEGFTVYTAYNGRETYDLFTQHDFAMILLDVMMPEMDGFTVCRKIRETSMVPIIMVTARGEDYERIMGLEIGADDYIVKPFAPIEVMARIKAILRRIDRKFDAKLNEQARDFDNLSVNLDTFSATIADIPVPLTKKEIEILYILMEYPNKVFTRDNLLDHVWGYEYYGDTRTVDSHIKRLRAKLEEYDHPHWNITTVWGMGYKFEVKK